MLRSFLAALVLTGGVAAAADPFPLRDGDVVAFVGNTFVEREQRDGYIELALTLAHPEADVAFRNLGWSGDTVSGRARRFFGTTDEGFKHLLDHLDAVKPTAIVVCYGTNEAFDGEAGRASFLDGYGKLLDELAKRTDRIALVTSPPLQPDRSPAPAVAKRVNEELKRQAESLTALGAERGYRVVDLYQPLRTTVASDGDDRTSLTDNGLHYTPLGYRIAADEFVSSVTKTPHPMSGHVLGPEPGSEALRQAIVAKNELFFHRHRPQNETYLRGFRKHEQGNNAEEIYAFEPLVAEKDREIFKLREAVVRKR